MSDDLVTRIATLERSVDELAQCVDLLLAGSEARDLNLELISAQLSEHNKRLANLEGGS